MTHSAAGVAWSKGHRQPVMRLVSWHTVSYCMTEHRKHLSAPRFQRMVRETTQLFDRNWTRFEALSWVDLDGVSDLCRDVMTDGGSLLWRPAPEGRWARAYARMGWLERLALVDAHANRKASPNIWLLRAAVIDYCQAYGKGAPQWTTPRWPLNAGFGDDDDTLLHCAVLQHDRWAAQQLLTWGAVVTVTNRHGRTPLHNAAWRGDEELVALLLAKGADVHAVDAGGQTALCRALEAYHLDSALVLLRAGGTSPLLASRRDLLRDHARAVGDQVSVTLLDAEALTGVLPAAGEAGAKQRL